MKFKLLWTPLNWDFKFHNSHWFETHSETIIKIDKNSYFIIVVVDFNKSDLILILKKYFTKSILLAVSLFICNKHF